MKTRSQLIKLEYKLYTYVVPFYLHIINRVLLCLIEGDMEKEPVERLETGNSYSQGNLPDFLEYLRGVSGNENPKVSY